MAIVFSNGEDEIILTNPSGSVIDLPYQAGFSIEGESMGLARTKQPLKKMMTYRQWGFMAQGDNGTI